MYAAQLAAAAAEGGSEQHHHQQQQLEQQQQQPMLPTTAGTFGSVGFSLATAAGLGGGGAAVAATGMAPATMPHSAMPATAPAAAALPSSMEQAIAAAVSDAPASAGQLLLQQPLSGGGALAPKRPSSGGGGKPGMPVRDSKGRFIPKHLLPAYYAEQAALAAAAAAGLGPPLPVAGADMGLPGLGSPAAAGAAAAAERPGSVPAATAASAKAAATTGAAARAKQAGTAAGPVVRLPRVSLLGCLRRFVKPERLGAGHGGGSHWVCTKCGSSGAALKQLSLRRLPPVMCLHLKRFEQHAAGRVRKLDVPLTFPMGR